MTRGGGYYLDDGPGDSPPADLDSIPDAVPKLEPLHPGAMKPYVVMGQSFTPMPFSGAACCSQRVTASCQRSWNNFKRSR